MYVVMGMLPFEFLTADQDVLFRVTTNAVGFLPVYASREEAVNDHPGRMVMEITETVPATPLLVGEGTEER